MIDVLLDATSWPPAHRRRDLRPNLPRSQAPPRTCASAAVTRKPGLSLDGVEPIELAADSGVADGVAPPRLVRRLQPRSPTTSTLPSRAASPVLTVHDLSFEREPDLMPRKDRLVFRAVVPRSAKRADRVIAVSERTGRTSRTSTDPGRTSR